MITEQLQTFAEENDLFYPVDFASAGSSQIGDNISTNAGGISDPLGYDPRLGCWYDGRDGEGEILELNKDLMKNNTGYDMRQLFIGGEGTLGFVTEATMRLTRTPKNLTVLVLGIPELDDVMKVLSQFQSTMDLTAFEFFSDKAMQKVLARGDVLLRLKPARISTL